jgi:meiotically up-regulated gene 157 (Mug157) protein
MIRADPYANAFNYEPQSGGHSSDWSQRLLFGGIPFNAVFDNAIVFERKY